MKKNAAIMIVLAFELLLTAAVFAADIPPLRVGDPLPSLTFPALASQAMTIPDDVNGKVMVLHFWTDWCGSCGVVMPAYDKLYGLYRQKGLLIVGVNVGQTKKQVKKFVDKTKITYPVLLDEEKRSAQVYSVVGLPRTYIIDRKGIVRYKLIGEVPEETIQKFLLDLL